MPIISVVIPVYNADRYLSMSIESVLSQTFHDFELLLIDDGSTDRSGELCDQYAAKDNRIRVFHQLNAGVSAARNRGICESSGEWIAFVDSDDIIPPEYLCKLYEKVDEKVKFVVGGMQYVIFEKTGRMESIKKIKPNPCLITSREYWRLANDGVIGTVWGKLFFKDLISSARLYFDTTMPMGEDKYFVLKYLQHLKNDDLITVIDEELYLYRYDSVDSITKRYIPHYIDIGFRIHHEYEIMANTIGNGSTEAVERIRKDKAQLIDYLLGNITRTGRPKGIKCIREIKEIVDIPRFKEIVVDNSIFFVGKLFRKVLSTQNALIIYIYIVFSGVKKKIKKKC